MRFKITEVLLKTDASYGASEPLGMRFQGIEFPVGVVIIHYQFTPCVDAVS
jgi:hypothetical protein